MLRPARCERRRASNLCSAPRRGDALGRRGLELRHERLVVGAVGGVVVHATKLGQAGEGSAWPAAHEVDGEQAPDPHGACEARVTHRRLDVSERHRHLVEPAGAEQP